MSRGGGVMAARGFHHGLLALLGVATAATACGEPSEDEVFARSGEFDDGPIDVAPRLQIGPTPMVSVDAGDLDGDGLPDVAMFGGSVRAWLESPDDPATGTWTRRDFSFPVTRPFIGSAKIGDMDGDGDEDIVVSMDNHSNAAKSLYVYVLENPGGAPSGSWPTHTIVSNYAVHHVNDMELADMDGDGKLDVVMRSLDVNRIHLLFQNDLDSWQHETIDSSQFHAQGEGFAVGDIDGIGHLDISISGYWMHAPASPRTGSYTAHVIDAAAPTPTFNHNTKEALGDVDGDGDLDIVISPAEGYRGGPNYDLAVYLNPGNPRSAASWPKTVLKSGFNGGHFARFGDMDDDGDLDVVSGVAWNSWGQSRSLRIFYNLGGGTFGNEQVVHASRGIYSGALVDIGSDGDLDIVGGAYYQGQLDVHESLVSDGVTGTPGSAYGRIEAESYDAMQGLGIYSGGTGQKIGSIHDGEWVRFDDLDFGAGAGSVLARVASPNSNDQEIELRLDAVDGPLIATIDGPNTGGWNTFVDVSTGVGGATGVHDLYLVFRGTAGYLIDVDYFEFSPGAVVPPSFSRVEAESYDAMQGLGIYSGGTGQKIGSIHDGEWVRYDDYDFGAGASGVSASVSAQLDNDGRIEFRLDAVGGPLVGSVDVPTTGSWQSFTDVATSISGATGVHDLYLVFRGSSGFLLDVDYFEFE